MSRKIFNQTEKDEHIYLERTKEKIKQTIANTDKALSARSKEIKENKDYQWENKAGWIMWTKWPFGRS